VKAREFFSELKRRNVYKVAAAYAVVAWLLIQFTTQVFPFFEVPNWAVRLVILLLVLASPVVLICAWAFEITPEGIKRTEDVAPGKSIRRRTGRKLTAITAIVIAIAVALLLVRLSRPATSRTTGVAGSSSTAVEIPEKSIAVLPFENLSADKANAFFADGVQDEILTDLAKIAELKVISRVSVLQYRNHAADRNVRTIGKDLGVAHVLEGSVQRAGDRVRVTAQLIDARTDAHLWAEHYDRDVSDVFAIQSEIAEKIADQLRAKLSPREKAAIEQAPTADLAAFDFYIRAKTLLVSTSFSARGKDNLLEAVKLLDEAVARDPSFLLAYCQLASAHDQLYFLALDHTPERLSLGDAAVQNALRVRADAGEAHLALARHLYQAYLSYDHARAELAIAGRALPNDPLVPELAGYIDRRQGRWEESTKNLERALELDPRNFFTLQQISLSYNLLRRYQQMAAVLDRALAIVPNDLDTRATRAQIELDWHADTRPLHATLDQIVADNPTAAGDVADARLLIALCERDSDAATRAVAALTSESFGVDAIQLSREFGAAMAARIRGDAAAARAAFAAAREKQEEAMRGQVDYAPAICVLGLIDAGLGRKEDALREGRRAIELLPIAKDSVNGAHMIEFFAVICAWVGEKNLACDQLEIATRIPGTLSYGQLRLYPFWDELRGDPRFEKIVGSLAPAT
jgi:TolB-like protein/Tfp pilus assembly protein PilF